MSIKALQILFSIIFLLIPLKAIAQQCEKLECDTIYEGCKVEAELKIAYDSRVRVWADLLSHLCDKKSKDYSECLKQIEKNAKEGVLKELEEEYKICDGIYETCLEKKEKCKKLSADKLDCRIGTLEVKIFEKGESDGVGKKGEVLKKYKSSHKKEAGGLVVFITGKGKMDIIYKSLSGSASTKTFREETCVIHEGHTEGRLLEGHMTEGKLYAPYWKYSMKGITTVKPIKGCRQDPIPPIEGVEEVADWRFEGIVRPCLGKLGTLCESVKKTPDKGFCYETPRGFSGKKIEKVILSEVRDGDSKYYAHQEDYTWNVKRVPCE